MFSHVGCSASTPELQQLQQGQILEKSITEIQKHIPMISWALIFTKRTNICRLKPSMRKTKSLIPMTSLHRGSKAKSPPPKSLTGIDGENDVENVGTKFLNPCSNI
ncbi:proline-rich receptor-like protein kinase PERK13 [Sesbania bispinosa]|nr:proline-rich receptor-like protein kinase PERK13 [Sesbania bispinosa]